MFRYQEFFAVTIGICILSSVINANHYRGGTIYWNAVDDNPNQVKITYRLGFKLGHIENGHDDCLDNTKERGELLETTGSLKCDQCNNGEDVKIRDLDYQCTDYNVAGQWASGVNSFIYDAPATRFNVSYESCCWIGLVSHEIGTGRGWKLTSAIDLTRRPDTGHINSSPISEALPVQFMEKGCKYALQIPVIDPDNDHVRCRWPNMDDECNQKNNGVCGPTPNANLRQNDCTLRINTRKMQAGWHAVNLIIEDFANETSTEPLSKVAQHFLLNVLDTPTCTKPEVISPPPGLCRTLAVGSHFRFPLIARVVPSRRINSFTTLKPKGMTASEVRHIPGTFEFYTELSWTPTIDQVGKHTLCFQATDNANSPTNMVCMYLNVMETVGSLTVEHVAGSDRGDFTLVERLRFRFNGEIEQPRERAYIKILDAYGREEFKLDVSNKSADITFEGSYMEFGLNDHVLHMQGTGHRLVFDEGVAKGASKCGLRSQPNEWVLQDLGVQPGRRKPPSSIAAVRPRQPVERAAFPQCFSSSMTIYVSKKIVGEIAPHRLHLIDPSCRGENHNETHYVIGTGYGMCGTTFQNGEDQNDESSEKIFGNVVYLPAAPYSNGSIITRDDNIEIHVNCTVSGEHLTHVEFDPEVKTLIYYESGYGYFNFSLKMYRNDDFKKLYKLKDFPVDVDLKERLYFEARTFSKPGTELLLDACRATPTANPFDQVQYTFIRDGCEVDDTVQMHPIRFSQRKRFSISAFAFLGKHMENSVFVHCDMRLCDLMDPKSKCARSCAPTRRVDKRDVSGQVSSSSAAYQETDGPIIIVASPEDFEETSSVFHAKADLIQTIMLGVVILLIVTLMVLYLRGITCTQTKQQPKGANYI